MIDFYSHYVSGRTLARVLRSHRFAYRATNRSRIYYPLLYVIIPWKLKMTLNETQDVNTSAFMITGSKTICQRMEYPIIL